MTNPLTMTRSAPGLVVTLSVLAGGCAFGHQFRYHDLTVHVPKPGVEEVAVGTLDHREYVVSEESDPSYIGMTRAGYGNPFDAHTESGDALADELTGVVVSALRRDGVEAVAVSTTYRDREAGVREKLLSRKTPRAILILLYDWQSDTYNDTSLFYDAEVQVLDAEGKSLAKERFKGEDDLGGSFWDPVGHAQAVIPAGASTRIESFFAAPSIVEALKSQGHRGLDSSDRPVLPNVPARSIESRLSELKRLYERGLIDQREYDTRRQEILDQL